MIWLPGEGEICGLKNLLPKHEVANCSLTMIPMLPFGKYKLGVGTIPSFAKLFWCLLLLVIALNETSLVCVCDFAGKRRISLLIRC